MTVSQLIEQLLLMPQDSVVIIDSGDQYEGGPGKVDEVSLINDEVWITD